jgi:O-antigen/teichoic acid export membrane protein
MISKRFLKTSFLYTVTGALPQVAPVILLPFYTLHLSKAQFGYLNFYIAFSQLIQILVTFSFDSVITSHYFEFKSQPERLKKYLSSVVIMLLLIGGSIVSILLFLGPSIFDVVYETDAMAFYPYGLISVFTGIFTSILKVGTNLYIAQQKPEKYSFSNILNFLLIISLSISGLYLFPKTLIGPMYGRFVAGIISFSIIIFSYFRSFGIQFDFSFLKTTLKFNQSLFIVNIVTWFVNNVDYYIIHYLMNDSEVGIFNFAARPVQSLEVVLGALLNAIMAPIYSIWSTNQNSEKSIPEVNRYYNVMSSMSILIIGASIIGFPIILSLIIKKDEYYQAFEYIPLICLQYITYVVWVMYSLPLMFDKNGSVFKKTLIGSAVFKLLIGYLLISQFGLYGAVWSVLLTKIFQHIWIAIESHKIYHLKYNKIKILLLPAIYAILVIISTQFLPNQFEIYYHLGSLFIFGLIIFFVFKNEIILVLKKYGLKF